MDQERYVGVDTNTPVRVMTKEQLAKQPFGDIAGPPAANLRAHVTRQLGDPRQYILPASSRHQSAIIKIGRDKSEMDTFRSIRLERRTGEKVLKPVDSNGKPLTREAHRDGGFD
ncbi:aryl-sulfate sulfotransferase [Salmonella enterica subsp. enterica]|nr:aryl-sulfate sulfotransferase [Salmonella enterica subsp. enterica]